MSDEKLEMVFHGNKKESEIALNTLSTIDIQKKMEEILFKINLRSSNTNSITSTTKNIESEPTDCTSTIGCVLCVLYMSGKIGAAYFDNPDRELYIIEDVIEMSPEFNLTKNLYLRLNPGLTITVSRQNTLFFKALTETIKSDDTNSTGTQNLQFLKEKEYSYERCVNAVKNLKLSDEPKNLTSQLRSVYLHSIIDFTKTVSIHALGVLLLFLDKYRNDARGFHHLNIGKISDAVMMDNDTFKALQIFKPKSRTQCHNRVVEVTEDPNLFKIFNRCKCAMGQNRLKYLLLQPTNDSDTLEKRYEFIEFCIKSNNQFVVDEMTRVLKKTRSVTMIMENIRGNTANLDQWKILKQTLHNLIHIREVVSSHTEEVLLFQEYFEVITDEIITLSQYIDRNIDFTTEHNSGKVTIKDGIDEFLDAKRCFCNSLLEKITSAAAVELNNLPTMIENCCIMYIPEIGYILSIKKWGDDANCLDLEQFGMKYLFHFEGRYNYKSPICEELDRNFGDIHLEILSREVQLIADISTYVGGRGELLRHPLKMLSLFDSLLAMAEIAKEYNFTKPILNNEGVIIIENGRHPLLNILSASCIPNDYKSGIESRLKILTGPHGSGKSIYLKQNAMIVYLAHIGSFVPATKAVINLTSGIYTRIQPPNLVSSESISSFLHSLRQMTRSSISSDVNSLIIIDEFGKGTIDEDGLALLTAYLKSFLIRQEYCPHILVSTHYLQLTNLLPESCMVEHLRPSFRRDEDKIIFLHKIEKGVSESYAAEAALLAGIPRSIVERSREILKAYRETRSTSTLPASNSKFSK